MFGREYAGLSIRRPGFKSRPEHQITDLKQIILVTGTPGVGKSRLAGQLAKNGGYALVEVSNLVKKEGLYVQFDRKRGSYVVDERKLRKRLEALALSSEKMIVSSHIVGKYLPERLVRRVLVLRLDPTILYKRLRARGWTRRKAWENTEAEILDISLQESLKLLGKNRVSEIDTTGRSALSLYNTAVRVLSRATTGRVGQVNWLARYDPIELERRL